jgi:hypothetical protein
MLLRMARQAPLKRRTLPAFYWQSGDTSAVAALPYPCRLLAQPVQIRNFTVPVQY